MERFRTLLAGWCGFAPLVVAAQIFTTSAVAETVKIVVPFAAGGPIDQLARLLTPELAVQLKTDVIVEDRDGAGGAIGADFVAHATPDGNTLLLASMGGQVLGPILRPPTTYDPVKSFVPVMMVATMPSLLVVNRDLGVAGMKDLIAKAKAQKLTYGSAGPGTTMNIAVEMLNNAAGVKITHVPYRGAAPAINDLLGGHVDMLNADLPVLLPLVKAGTVTPIALFASERTPLLPDLPTANEQGLKDFDVSAWNAILLPKSATPEMVAKLNGAVSKALDNPALRERFDAIGLIAAAPARRSPEYLRKFIEAEVTKWAVPVKAAGLKVD
jgi:tripartite-type tricarboxylate transporter receptor subunit TctC